MPGPLRGDWLDRWATFLLAEQASGRRSAGFANNRYEGAGFVTASALRTRLDKAGRSYAELWPEPRLPGFETL